MSNGLGGARANSLPGAGFYPTIRLMRDRTATHAAILPWIPRARVCARATLGNSRDRRLGSPLRWMLALTVAWLAGTAFGADRPQEIKPTAKEAGEVKICTWNMNWFPSGSPEKNTAKEESKRIDSAARFLRWWECDVVLFQEMRDRGTCERLLKPGILDGWSVNACADYSHAPGTTMFQQDAILSRFRTLDGGHVEFDRRREHAPPRGFVWAVLDVSGKPMLFVTTHLKSNRFSGQNDDKDAELLEDMRKREESARQILAWLAKAETKTYEGKPVSDVFVGGDFNTSLFDPAFKKEKSLTLFLDAGYEDTFAGVERPLRSTMPDWWGKPGPVLDYLLHKGPAQTVHPQVAPRQYTSDHRLIGTMLKTARTLRDFPAGPAQRDAVLDYYRTEVTRLYREHKTDPALRPTLDRAVQKTKELGLSPYWSIPDSDEKIDALIAEIEALVSACPPSAP